MRCFGCALAARLVTSFLFQQRVFTWTAVRFVRTDAAAADVPGVEVTHIMLRVLGLHARKAVAVLTRDVGIGAGRGHRIAARNVGIDESCSRCWCRVDMSARRKHIGKGGVAGKTVVRGLFYGKAWIDVLIVRF